MSQPPNRLPLTNIPSSSGARQSSGERTPESVAAHFYDHYLTPINGLAAQTGRADAPARRPWLKSYGTFVGAFIVGSLILAVGPLFASYFNLELYHNGSLVKMRREEGQQILLQFTMVLAWAMPMILLEHRKKEIDENWNWHWTFFPAIAATFALFESAIYWIAWLIFQPRPTPFLIDAWGAPEHFIVTLGLFIFVFSLTYAGVALLTVGGLGVRILGGLIMLSSFLLGLTAVLLGVFVFDDVLLDRSAGLVVAVFLAALFAISLCFALAAARPLLKRIAGQPATVQLMRQAELAELQTRAGEIFPPVPPEVMRLSGNRKEFVRAYAQMIRQHGRCR